MPDRVRFTHRRVSLLLPEPHAHLAVHRRRGGEVLVGPLTSTLVALVPVELAEAKVAVGDDRAHAARFRERQRLAIVGLTARGIELIDVGRDVAEELQCMGCESRLARREFERAIAQAPRVLEPTQHQRGSTQPGIEPSESTG